MRTITIKLGINDAGDISLYCPEIRFEATTSKEGAPQATSELVRDWLDNEEAEQTFAEIRKQRMLDEHEIRNARANAVRQGRPIPKGTKANP